MNMVVRAIFGMITLLLFLGVGCTQEEDQSETQGKAKGEVELLYVEWASEVASTNVMKVVLEQQGYQVKTTPVSAAAMWQAVAAGDADGFVAAWLPTTHAQYLEAVGDQVENLGPNLEGTRIGLVVPAFVTITSIPELPAEADKFDGRIIGIDPGAGIMEKTEKAMQAYGLNDKFKLISGSGATMTASLKDAVENNNWVVVTGWTPHWMFARWDLKYLEDPQKVYGGEEHISTIVRTGLQEDMPEVYAILDNFNWTPDDMQQVMIWNREENADPYESAKRWVAQNQDKVSGWIPEQATE